MRLGIAEDLSSLEHKRYQSMEKKQEDEDEDEE
jgi:hypothetical protein